MTQPSSDNPAQQAPENRSNRKRVWLRRGFELVLVLVIIFGVRAWQQRDIAKGAAAPLYGELLDGTPYLMHGKPDKPLLVHFWATWCPICKAEQGSIEAMHQDQYNIITVAMQSGSSKSISGFMQAEGTSFPVINDADGRISASWGVRAVPASFIVDSDGQIRFVEIGYTTGWGLRLRMWLAGI